MSQALSRSLKPALLERQAVQNLPLPAVLDALDPDRRDVDRHSVLEPRAQESMDVRVGRAILSTVLMDRKHAWAPRAAPRRVFSTASCRTRSESCPSNRLKRSAVGLSTVRMKRK